MRLSRETRYAIAALVALAQRPPRDLVKARELAAATDLPPSFLAKVLQSLARAGLLTSIRGRGYQLGRPPEAIQVSEIITAMEGQSPNREACIFWREECSETQPCMLHWIWRDLRPAVEEQLAAATLADIVAGDHIISSSAQPGPRRTI